MGIIRYVAPLLCLILAGCGEHASGYSKVDGEWVWVFRGARAGAEVTKLDADHDSFVVLANKRYAKDKRQVFLERKIIEGADPSTFQLLGESSFAKDKSHVYLKKYRIPGADPASFRIIAGPYSRDASRVYCGTVPMETADIDSFEVVKNGGLWVTSYDKGDFLFSYGPAFEGLEISKDHPALTGEGWARDGKYWYYGPGRVEDADYASFTITGGSEASDKNRKYFWVFPEERLADRRKRFLGIDAN